MCRVPPGYASPSKLSECIVRDDEHTPGKLVRSMCNKHYTRWQRHGDPLVVLSSTGGGQKGSEHHAWRGDNAGYFTFHKRVKQERGKASSCAWGCQSKTYNWANIMGNLADPWDYVSMCRRCHTRFDAAQNFMASRKDALPWVTHAMRLAGVLFGTWSSTCALEFPELHHRAKEGSE